MLVLEDFQAPPLGQDALTRQDRLQSLLDERSPSRPVVDRARCVACGICVEQCPAKALHCVEGFPEADPQACIACFCCQEMCPEKAIALAAPAR